MHTWWRTSKSTCTCESTSTCQVLVGYISVVSVSFYADFMFFIADKKWVLWLVTCDLWRCTTIYKMKNVMIIFYIIEHDINLNSSMSTIPSPLKRSADEGGPLYLQHWFNTLKSLVDWISDSIINWWPVWEASKMGERKQSSTDQTRNTTESAEHTKD